MIRYIALVWNCSESGLLQKAHMLGRRFLTSRPGWRMVFERDGLSVYCARTLDADPERLYTLDDSRGVVLGRLFERGSSNGGIARDVVLDATRTGEIVATGGRCLIDKYWGRFVAFVRDSPPGKTWVVRDPTGNVLCLTAVVEGIDVFFCRLTDYSAIADNTYSVNWRHVAGFLAYGYVPRRTTGLVEVAQVQPGECVTLHAGTRSRQFYWNPLQVAATNVIEDPVAATEALRQTTRACVHAWASCYNRILHLLSGGVDSSIVLACLQDAPSRPEIISVNYYSEGSDTDEREYARLAAERAGCELLEIQRNPACSWEPLLDLGPSPYPCAFIGNIEVGRPLAQLAQVRSATARFSGTGGDLLFYTHGGNLATADHVRRYGVSRHLFRIALDAAYVDRKSVWSVLADAIRYGLLRHPLDLLPDITKDRTLMPVEALKAAQQDESRLHPLYRTIPDMPRGKLNQAHIITFALDPYYSPLEQPDDPDHVAPLFSQPLIELCLRIPTYVLMRNGRDRAIARDAFANKVPKRIILRRTKGGVEEHTKSVLFRNIRVVRQLLCGGTLVRQGLLDAKKLEEVLSRAPSRIDSSTAELYTYINTEAWLRGLSRVSERKVA